MLVDNGLLAGIAWGVTIILSFYFGFRTGYRQPPKSYMSEEAEPVLQSERKKTVRQKRNVDRMA